MLALTGIILWTVLGFIGQFIFGMRFVVQWIATEQKKKSVVPVAFWHLSILGTIILLIYSIHKRDVVFIAGFSLNMLIYSRNLYFIYRKPDAQRPEDASLTTDHSNIAESDNPRNDKP